jgi:hypothetical protein
MRSGIDTGPDKLLKRVCETGQQKRRHRAVTGHGSIALSAATGSTIGFTELTGSTSLVGLRRALGKTHNDRRGPRGHRDYGKDRQANGLTPAIALHTARRVRGLHGYVGTPQA